MTLRVWDGEENKLKGPVGPNAANYCGAGRRESNLG